MRHSNRSTLIAAVLVSLIVLATLPVSTFAEGSERLSLPGPLLDRPSDFRGKQSFRARGSDPIGGRLLELWLWTEGQFRRLGTTRSSLEGRFDFGQHPIPAGRAEWSVSVAGDPPSRSRGMVLDPVLPAPVVLATVADSHEITLIPALFEGALRIYDLYSGRLLYEAPIDARAARGKLLDLEEEGLSAQTDAFMIEHILDDGFRSESTLWRLPAEPAHR